MYKTTKNDKNTKKILKLTLIKMKIKKLIQNTHNN